MSVPRHCTGLSFASPFCYTGTSQHLTLIGDDRRNIDNDSSPTSYIHSVDDGGGEALGGNFFSLV